MPYGPPDQNEIAAMQRPEDDMSDASGIVSLVLEALMVFANIFPIMVVCRWKKPRDRLSTDEIIVALSIADILSVIVPTPLGLISFFSRRWYGGFETCAFYQLTLAWFQLASMSLITYMCIDRLLTVRLALSHRVVLPGPYKIKIIILLIYLITLFFACMPLMGLAPRLLSKSGRVCQSWIVATPSMSKEHTFYIVFVTLGFANLLAVIFTNFRVIWILRLFIKGIEMPGEKSSMKISSVSVDRKTVVDCTKMVITITVVAYLAWLPALVMILLLRLPVQGEISIPAVLYAMSSTTLTGLFNPIIYGIFSASYRNGYRGVVRSFFHLLCGCRREDFDMIDDVTTRARRMRSAENTSVSSRSLGGVMSPSGTLTSSSSAHVREILLVDDQQDEYQPVANQMMSFNSQYSSLYAANGRNAGSFQNKPKISGGGVHVESAIEEEAQDSVENSPLTPRRFAKFSKFQHYIFSQKRSKYNNANNRRRHHREIESNSSLLTCTSDDDEASDDMSYDSDGADGCTDKKPNRNGKFSSDNIQIEESEI